MFWSSHQIQSKQDETFEETETESMRIFSCGRLLVGSCTIYFIAFDQGSAKELTTTTTLPGWRLSMSLAPFCLQLGSR